MQNLAYIGSTEAVLNCMFEFQQDNHVWAWKSFTWPTRKLMQDIKCNKAWAIYMQSMKGKW